MRIMREDIQAAGSWPVKVRIGSGVVNADCYPRRNGNPPEVVIKTSEGLWARFDVSWDMLIDCIGRGAPIIY